MGRFPPELAPKRDKLETEEEQAKRIIEETTLNEPVKYAKPTNTPKEEEKVVEVAKNDEFQWIEIKMTSYNAEIWQTDSTPCIAWWTWVNICDAEKEGRRIIALSQELTAWSQLWKARKSLDCWYECMTFEAREQVKLTQTQASIDEQWYNPRCNWNFEVSDAMNVRYRKRWDLFFSDRAMNTSCDVIITKTIWQK